MSGPFFHVIVTKFSARGQKDPIFQPSTQAQRATPKVCMVTGTPEGIGIWIWDKTARTAVIIPVMTMVLVEIFCMIWTSLFLGQNRMRKAPISRFSISFGGRFVNLFCDIGWQYNFRFGKRRKDTQGGKPSELRQSWFSPLQPPFQGTQKIGGLRQTGSEWNDGSLWTHSETYGLCQIAIG